MNFQVGERVVVISNNHFYGKLGTIVGYESPYNAKSCFYVGFPNYKGDVASFASNNLQRVSETYYQEHIKSQEAFGASTTYTVEQFEKDIREAIEKIAKEGWKVEQIYVKESEFTDASGPDGACFLPKRISFDMDK